MKAGPDMLLCGKLQFSFVLSDLKKKKKSCQIPKRNRQFLMFTQYLSSDH